MSKISISEALLEKEETKYMCETCSNAIQENDSQYCVNCRMYWDDVSNGLFDKDDW